MPQVTVRKLVEGDAHVVIRVDMLGDLAEELTKYVILSPEDLNPRRKNNRNTFRIMQLWYGCVWFDVALGFGTVTPETVWNIARDCDSHSDFRSFGGLLDYNATPPIDEDGRLWISTNGFGVGSQGTLVIELRKTNTP